MIWRPNIEQVGVIPQGAIELSALCLDRAVPIRHFIEAARRQGYRLVQCRQHTFAVRIH